MKKLRLLFLFFFPILWGGCYPKPIYPFENTPIVIGAGNLDGDGREGIAPGNFVIRDQAAWDTLQKKMTSATDLSAQLWFTQVNFSRDVVIAIFDSIRPSAGYTIGMGFAVPNGDSLLIGVRSSGPDGPAAAVITQPFEILRVAKHFDPIVFRPE